MTHGLCIRPETKQRRDPENGAAILNCNEVRI